MRKGFVSADWMVGFGIFLVFAALTIGYYVNISSLGRAQPLESASDAFTDKITGFLLVDVYEFPVFYDSPGSSTDSISYLDFSWPFGKNTTRVFRDGSPLECEISGDRLYWKSDMAPGKNNFTVRFTGLSGPTGCSASLNPAGANMTIPASVEKGRMFSQARIAGMNSTPYETFRQNLGINRDFRVEMNISGTPSSYGPEAPSTSDVFVKEMSGSLLETGQKIKVRILVW